MSACPKCAHSIVGQPNFCPACGASLTYDHHSDDALIGRTIGGSYELRALIGEGAMGRVYKAYHIQLRKDVALKILRSNLISDSTVVKRFEREAHAASRLNHPNCISIFGFGQEDDGDILWMAMEFIAGRDLGTIISEDSPLPAQRVVNIMGQVCEALDEAHEANIIHRDLKPANIVCFDHRRTKDFVKVLDFGIAKITDPGDDYQPLTRDGIVCGTPAFMSPEQVQGFELDNRSDLFSLGIILYQTITGQLPFFAESAVEVATKIVIDEPVPPSQVRSDWTYPQEIEDVVLRLLAKKKEDRFSNAIEVKEALERCMEKMRARHDVSLDLAPDQVAELLAEGDDDQVEGAATLQLSSDVIAQAMAGGILPSPSSIDAAVADLTAQAAEQQNRRSPESIPNEMPSSSGVTRPSPSSMDSSVTAPSPRPAPIPPRTVLTTDQSAAPPTPPPIMTGPSSAFRDDPIPERGIGGALVGLGVVLAVAAGAGAWWFFGQ